MVIKLKWILFCCKIKLLMQSSSFVFTFKFLVNYIGALFATYINPKSLIRSFLFLSCLLHVQWVILFCNWYVAINWGPRDIRFLSCCRRSLNLYKLKTKNVILIFKIFAILRPAQAWYDTVMNSSQVRDVFSCKNMNIIYTEYYLVMFSVAIANVYIVQLKTPQL